MGLISNVRMLVCALLCVYGHSVRRATACFVERFDLKTPRRYSFKAEGDPMIQAMEELLKIFVVKS